MKKIKIATNSSSHHDTKFYFFKEEALLVVPDLKDVVSKYPSYYQLNFYIMSTYNIDISMYFHNDTGPAYSLKYFDFSQYNNNYYYLNGVNYFWSEWKEERKKYRKQLQFNRKLQKVLK